MRMEARRHRPSLSERFCTTVILRSHQYTSEKPGINPETGNDLEPVYAEDATTIPAGALQVTPERQQLIGIRYGQASYESSSSGIQIRRACRCR